MKAPAILIAVVAAASAGYVFGVWSEINRKADRFERQSGVHITMDFIGELPPKCEMGEVKVYATSTGETAEFECLLRNFWGPRMKR